VTPSFNQAAFIEETMRSVLDQDYANIEYIVIDGGSTDGSVEIIKKYADRLAYWVSEPDRGQSDALNKGFARSRGEIMAWLCSDDVYVPGTISRAVEAFRANPRAAVVYGQTEYVDAQGHRRTDIKRNPFGYPFRRQYALRGGHHFSQPSGFWRRFAWQAVGPLRTDLHYTMDFDLWMSMAERFDFVYVPELWSRYRIHDSSKTGTSRAKFDQEGTRVRRDHHRRSRLLRLVLRYPRIYLHPLVLVFLVSRLAPRRLMLAVNRARGVDALLD
jgi:glycosyltransferase involved in cell wall biosynthesis